MEPIGVGVIGLGESGQHHLEVLLGNRVQPQASLKASEKLDLLQAGKRLAKRLLGRQSSELIAAAPPPPDPGIADLKVVAISDVDERRLHWAKEHFDVPYAFRDYKELLGRNDVRAIMICTPPTFHPEITIEAARHGKHVFCEKPMALSSARCLEMLEATEKAGVVLQIGYMLRFSSERGMIVDAIRNNVIGAPVLYREFFSLRAGGDQPWIHDRTLGGGPLWEVSHGIDFLRYLFGDPEKVFGIGGHYKPNKTSALDTYAVSLIFPSGNRAILGDSYALKDFGWDNTACRRQRTEIDIVGPGGYIQFPDADLSNKLTICCYGAHDSLEKHPWRSEWGANGYKDQLIHFAESIEHNKTPKISGEEGLRTALLVETIMKSI